MDQDIQEIINSLWQPDPKSHKGQNGKVMIIGGSKLFHAASLWALETASYLVDMVFYSSLKENNEIVQKIKTKWRNGIVVAREGLENYINEADVILIGPGMERTKETKELTHHLLTKYPNKKWVIDAGALQELELNDIPRNAILTPHHQEWKLLTEKAECEDPQVFIKKYPCTILLKGPEDLVYSKEKCVTVPGGNAGMTKGGTGDVLAGLVAGLYAKNNAFASAVAASYLNKKAGEKLYAKYGYLFNATDLMEEVRKVYKELRIN